MTSYRDTAVSRLRRIGGVVTAASLAFTLAACGSGGETLEVYNWGSADEAAVYDDAFARFSEAHDDITVNNSVIPVTAWGDYVSKLATQIAAGNSPDLLNMGLEGAQLSVDRDLLAPLDEVVDAAELERSLEGVPQELIDAFTVDGKLYEIPNGWQTMVIYVNPEIFEEKGVPLPDADWTWEEFQTTAEALTGDGVAGFGLPWGFFQIQPWFFSNGASLVAEDGSPNLTDPAVVEAATFIRDLVEADIAPDPTSVDVYSQFAAGKFAMVGAGRWPLPTWSDAGFTSYVPLPWPKHESHTTVFGGAGWAISKSAENKELAWDAIKTLTDEETITAITDIGQQIPVLPGTGTDTGDESVDSALEFLEGQVSTARPVPAPPYYDTLEAVTMRYMEQIVLGQLDPAEALQAAQDELEAEIK